MPLESPKLDDRTAQNLLDEARRLIPRYCPSWTDHNLSDPGITLLELFATMVETMIYRLNRVPEKSYITFLNLMGVRLQPAVPAKVWLTFWLPQGWFAANSEPVHIPEGFEVATQQTGTDQPPVSFMTDEALTLRPTATSAFFTGVKENADDKYTPHLFESKQQPIVLPDQADGLEVFGNTPQDGNCFAIGDSHDISGHIVKVTIDCSSTALNGSDTTPLCWEAYCGDRHGWQAIELLEGDDTTTSLTHNGNILLHLPLGMASLQIEENGAYWVRCRYAPGAHTASYATFPRIKSLNVVTIGGRVLATHATPILNEVIGRSNGKPRQTFRLAYAPVLPLAKESEGLQVQGADGTWEAWTCVESFAASQAASGGQAKLHYTLDLASGEVAFGPLIREPDGTERQYGTVPPQGHVLRFMRYRSGGGVVGNVGAKMLAVMKSPLAGVDRVENRVRATGGKDAETIERAALRAPEVLRTSERAVTAEDFERLAMAVPSGGIGRAHCVSGSEANQLMGDTSKKPSPSTVLLLLVPVVEQDARCLFPKSTTSSPEYSLGARRSSVAAGAGLEPGVPRRDTGEGLAKWTSRYIPTEDLQLHPHQSKSVQDYLDERKLLTTKVSVRQPGYKKVTVEAVLNRGDETNREDVVQEAEKQLYTYLNPLTGGPDGKGWPFGRSLFISEIYAILHRVAGVNYVEKLKLKTSEQEGSPQEIKISWDELIISGNHNIAAS